MTVGKAGLIQLEAAKTVEQPKHGIRADIQGLRALAVGAVLLFHMWDQSFSCGYLGVDVFFVISGFLMFAILTRRRLSTTAALEFYFRRLRRILPPYLFTIAAVLLLAVLFVHPFEYAQLLDETLPTALFYSNCPAVHGTSYFDLRSNNLFFQHTWSLATELQFYAVVPLLFVVVQFLAGVHAIFVWTFVLYIAVLSWGRQHLSYTRPDSQHMAPDGRVWQFAAGFVAHLLRDAGVFSRLKNEGNGWMKRMVKAAVSSFLPTAVLIALLFTNWAAEWTAAAKRAAVVGSSMWLLAQPSSSTLSSDWNVLACWPLRKLGDFSYSLYLVHWPLYVFHRYLHPQEYDLDVVAEREVKRTIGVSLISASLLVGFVVEETFKRFLSKVRSWATLIATLGSLYAVLIILFVYIGRHKMFAFDRTPVTREWADRVLEEVSFLHENYAARLEIGRVESLRLNRDIAKFGISLPPGNATHLPTRFPVTLSPNLFVQRHTGNGTKNIVVIGNSHAICAMPGLRLHFADEYANLTLFSATACMFAPLDKQIPVAREMCTPFMTELIPALEKWEHPIDVVMVFFGYARIPDFPIEGGSVRADPTFQFMQSFYSNLTRIAREVTFLTEVSMHFKVDQLRIVQQRLHDRRAVGEIGTTRKAILEQLAYLPSMRERFRELECRPCIRISFLDLWCSGRNPEAFCRSVNADNHLVYFADYHHVSVYGSLIQGEYLRWKYDEWRNVSQRSPSVLRP